MKILIDHQQPFRLAHGGAALQITETRAALEKIGIEVEWVCWWDPAQTGDLVHVFGDCHPGYLRLARQKGIPTVLTSLLTSICNRSGPSFLMRRVFHDLLRTAPGLRSVYAQTPWAALRECTHHVVGLEAERRVLEQLHHLPASAISVVPLGVQDAYFLPSASQAAPRSGPLVSHGTITARKRSFELAELAREARVPILFVGEPYSERDPYWTRFAGLIDGRYVLHRPHLQNPEEMRDLLGGCRGYVLYSLHENWCLAAHEAVACGLPILVPRQNWSQERFGTQARFFPGNDRASDLQTLQSFQSQAGTLSAPDLPLLRWSEVATELVAVYQTVLSNSR